jgi:hypothetical protein
MGGACSCMCMTRREDNIKKGIKKIWLDCVDWIHLT